MSIILVKFSFDAHNSVKNFGLLKWKSYIQINNSYVNSNLWQNSCVVNIFLNRDLVFFSLSLWKIKTKMAKYIITKFLNSMGRILIPLVFWHNFEKHLPYLSMRLLRRMIYRLRREKFTYELDDYYLILSIGNKRGINNKH